MQVIRKFPLTWDEVQTVMIPGLSTVCDDVMAKSKILKVCLSGDRPCIWALIDTDIPEMNRTVRMYVDERPCYEPQENYVGSIFYGNLDFHIFVE